jgi:GH24 family phage-related lysozyme (muramidase)
MSNAVIKVEPSTLNEQERNALAILAALPVDSVNELKQTLHLSEPGVVGRQTVGAFLTFAQAPPCSLDLSDAGVSAFKTANKLGNTGALAGVIGPETAGVYFNTLTQAANAVAMTANATSGTRQINAAGIALIKEFEGYAQLIAGTTDVQTYLDSVGVPTIGYGHTGSDVTPGLRITQAQAEDLLRRDLASAQRSVQSLITAPLTDNQFAALVSFVYNLGGGALQESTLRTMLNQQQYGAAADQFLRWNQAGGQVLAGLTRRRNAERTLFGTA